MLKLPLAAYDWALKHLMSEGDTDLFPPQFEISALKYLWPKIRQGFGCIDLDTYVWRGGRRFVVPKRMLSFRVATQLDPIDSVVFAALIRKYGPALENSRIPVAGERVFSYRLSIQEDGGMYADAPSWHDFWRKSLDKAKDPRCTHVIVADITDFYNQIYHHVLERQLDGAKLPKPAAKAIKGFLQTLTDKVSRGVPVGPHSSHLLAECALDATDRSLLSHGYDFCRYVDDIHIFAMSEDAATGALYGLAEILDNQQRLMLQNDKTGILTAAEFITLAESMLIDRPANQKEKDILGLIATKTGGDPYRLISLKDLSASELKVVTAEVVEQLLEHYLSATKIDYPRLSWLLRRLTQVGAPGGVEYVLSHLQKLSPILGPAARYLLSAVPNFAGDKVAAGGRVLAAFDLPVIGKSPYLQMVLLNLLVMIPDLDHVDEVTARYGTAEPSVRREILRVAGAGNRGDWLRDQKDEFRSMDPWARRAYVFASSALPAEEAHFWLKAVRDCLTPLEKVIAHYAFRKKDLKLGQIDIAK